MLYLIIITIQIACMYHVYKTDNKTYWYYVILLIPGIGAAIYAITEIFSKNDVAGVQKEFASVIKAPKNTRDLEEKLAFTDTFQNRINLADALLEQKNYAGAALHYQEALKGSDPNDYYANAQLLESLYGQDKYEEVAQIAAIIDSKTPFEGSRAQFLYGLALSKSGKEEAAEKIMKKIDRRYSNYPERLELAKFYVKNKKPNLAQEIIEEMKSEYLNLTGPNKAKYKMIFSEVDRFEISI